MKKLLFSMVIAAQIAPAFSQDASMGELGTFKFWCRDTITQVTDNSRPGELLNEVYFETRIGTLKKEFVGPGKMKLNRTTTTFNDMNVKIRSTRVEAVSLSKELEKNFFELSDDYTITRTDAAGVVVNKKMIEKSYLTIDGNSNMLETFDEEGNKISMSTTLKIPNGRNKYILQSSETVLATEEYGSDVIARNCQYTKIRQ